VTVFTKLLIVLITVNAVVSQLLLKRATTDIGTPQASAPAVWKFVLAAAQSEWVYAAVTLQIIGFVLWMVLVSREKLGVATASVGAGFYLLMAFSAWMVYGETLTPVQWAGIVFLTIGVVCISWSSM
jgi:drug/metabolite transporter (DMT)-like permease